MKIEILLAIVLFACTREKSSDDEFLEQAEAQDETTEVDIDSMAPSEKDIKQPKKNKVRNSRVKKAPKQATFEGASKGAVAAGTGSSENVGMSFEEMVKAAQLAKKNATPAAAESKGISGGGNEKELPKSTQVLASEKTGLVSKGSSLPSQQAATLQGDHSPAPRANGEALRVEGSGSVVKQGSVSGKSLGAIRSKSPDKSENVQVADPRTKVIKSRVLAIRESPSLKARIVRYLVSNEKVKVIKEGWNGWSQIGASEFVRTKYLKSNEHDTIGEGGVAFSVKAEAVYIRSAPRPDAEVIGVAVQGDIIKAYGGNGDWLNLGGDRFIYKAYLQPLGH